MEKKSETIAEVIFHVERVMQRISIYHMAPLADQKYLVRAFLGQLANLIFSIVLQIG